MRPQDRRPIPGHRLRRARNFWLLGAIVGLVLLSGFWKSDVVFHLADAELRLPGLVRDIGLVLVTIVSLKVTPASVHEDNQFSWGPMQEVAKLFAGIFDILPVIAMLRAGIDGPFGAVIAAVTRARRHARPRDVLLGQRDAELLPGQCPHLPGVLQHRRR